MIAFALLIPTSVPAMAKNNFSPRSAGAIDLAQVNQFGGSTQAAAINGNYAYVGVGPRLVVYDISDLANPNRVSSTAPFTDLVYGVAIFNDQVLVAAGSAGFYIYDASTPGSLTRVSSLTNIGIAHDIAIAAVPGYDYALVACDRDGLHRIDITDTSNIHDAGVYDSGDDIVYGAAASGSYAYVAYGEAGLVKLDITSAPTSNPTFVSAWDNPSGAAYGVAVSGSYAYVANYEDLATINTATMLRVNTDGSTSAVNSAKGVAISGSTLYLADYADGFDIFDISTASNPNHVKSVECSLIQCYPERATVSSGYAYVAGGDGGLHIFDVDPAASAYDYKYALQFPGNPQNFVRKDNYLFVADRMNGLAILDINDLNPIAPGNPYSDPAEINAVFSAAVNSNYVYLANNEKGLLVVDITDIANPAKTGGYDTTEVLKDIVYANNHVYGVSGSNGKLYSFDVSNPASIPAPAGVNLNEAGQAIVLGENTAYVADGSNGIAAIDLANPAAPGAPVYTATGSEARDVALNKNTLYVADGNSGLGIYTITSDKLHPVYRGRYDTPGYAASVSVEGGYAYINDRTSVLAIDVSKPSNPTLADSINIAVPYCDAGILASDGAIFSGCNNGGMYIYKSRKNISGRITDESGAGIGGIELTLNPLGETATTLVNGAYEFNEIPPDAYSLTPSNEVYSFTPASYDVDLGVSDLTDLNFVQSPVHLTAPTHASNIPMPGKSALLDWDAVAGATKYKVLVSTNGGTSWKTAATRKASQTNYKLKIQQHKVYQWKIQAQVGGAWKESTVFTFTPPYPPAKPQLKLPANNAKNQQLKPTFRWKNPKATWTVDHYVLQVKPAGGTWTDLATIFDESTLVNYTPTSNLLANTSYQWRVNACNNLPSPNTQCSGLTAARKFKTGP
jgi:hypothetical protein